MIYKYDLNSLVNKLTMRKPTFLDVQQQGSGVVLWVNEDLDAELEDYMISAVCTGEEPIGTYICTLQMGSMVYHFYWEKL